MKRSRSTTPEENAQKATLKKLDTIISNRDPIRREKQKAYSKDPKVQTRRRFMNKKRRQLHTLLASMLKKDQLTYNGQAISEIGNRVVIPSKKVMIGWENSLEDIQYTPYTSEVDILESPLNPSLKKKTDPELSRLVENLLNGDEELEKRLTRKKKITQVTDERVGEVIKFIKENYSDELRKKYVLEAAQEETSDLFQESSEESDQEQE